ncbi:MAG: hypothetical protein LUC30_05950 [Clostridiales bacterium]|nr:hypothetical protein [Clostridiales bacterium]
MEPLTAAVALLAAVGLAALLWLFFGRFLLPVGELAPVEVRLCPGPGLEQTLRGLSWLAAAGLLESRISVLAVGLLPEERAETLQILRRWPEVEIVEGEAL